MEPQPSTSKQSMYSVSSNCKVCGRLLEGFEDGYPWICSFCRNTYEQLKNEANLPKSINCTGNCGFDFEMVSACLRCRMKKCLDFGLDRMEEENAEHSQEPKSPKASGPPQGSVLCPACNFNNTTGYRYDSDVPVCHPCASYFVNNFGKDLERAWNCASNCRYKESNYCKFCRYNNCVRVGMKKKAAKADQEMSKK